MVTLIQCIHDTVYTLEHPCYAIIVQELAIKKRHQAYRIADIVQNAPMKPKS